MQLVELMPEDWLISMRHILADTILVDLTGLVAKLSC